MARTVYILVEWKEMKYEEKWMGDETMETDTRLLFQETHRKGKREEKIEL